MLDCWGVGQGTAARRLRRRRLPPPTSRPRRAASRRRAGSGRLGCVGAPGPGSGVGPQAPQDQASGFAANEYGRQTARRIAEIIGAKLRGPARNEADYKGRRVVIKCAKAGTTSVGVTYKMQPRIDEVIGAFGATDRTYDLFALPVADFIKHQRQTASTGASAGRVAQTSKPVA